MYIVGKAGFLLKIKIELFFLKLWLFKHIRKKNLVNLFEAQIFLDNNKPDTVKFNDYINKEFI